jgi:hypothetical protein
LTNMLDQCLTSCNCCCWSSKCPATMLHGIQAAATATASAKQDGVHCP